VAPPVRPLLPSHDTGQIFFPSTSPIESVSPNLPFLNWSFSWLYKSRPHIFPPPSNSFAVSRELPRCHNKLGALPRHHRPPSRAPRRLRDSSAFAFDLGEIALTYTPSRYLLIVEWCSDSSFSVLRRWRRRESRRCGSVSAERRRRLFPNRSDPFIWNSMAVDEGYRFGCAFC
jgi:hypothetical protein